MKVRWFIPIALLIPLRLSATDAAVGARVATITINPRDITVLHLRPEFESTIRMPEEVTSVILGSPGEFKAEHNEGEPEYVYVKPITKQAAQSNLLIATKSGQHVTLKLVSDGTGIPNQSQPVDFLIEYRSARSFLISADSGAPAIPAAAGNVTAHESSGRDTGPESSLLSNLDEEFRLQQRVNAPKWTKWQDNQIETSIGDIRQWILWTIVLLTLPQLLSWIAAQGINIPSGSGSVATSWLASMETVFRNFVNQIVVAKLVPVIAAYFVLKATLDGAAGENPLGSIVAALFLMSLSATMQLLQGSQHEN
jgi:hypothetical protein